MVTINASPERNIRLGYAGEDKVTKVIFPYDESWLEYGDGEFFIRVLRPGYTEPYNAQDVTNDSEAMTLTLVVTDVELSKEGYGQMQVVYSGADFVKKSPIYSYNVKRAVDEVSDPPAQDVYTQIIESLSDLQVDIRQIDLDVADLSELTTAKIGDLSALTTEVKTDLVSAINEVNEHGGGGGSVTVDDVLSNVSKNPVQNKVITARITSAESAIASAQTAVQGKADIQTVSALSDAIQDLDGDVQGLQTAVQAKADTATVTALSGTVSGLQTTKADKSYVDTELAGKASTATATTSADGLMSAQDKANLDAVYTDYSSALTALGVI